jgi:hypothetical protein
MVMNMNMYLIMTRLGSGSMGREIEFEDTEDVYRTFTGRLQDVYRTFTGRLQDRWFILFYD